MLCVDLFLAVAVSTMQSLNGGREPGHRRTPNLNRVSKEQRTKREEVTTNQKLMLCVDLFLAVVVSTMQSLNGGREPGHRRCRHRGRMMRGDAAAVTGAVPAVSLAATPSRSSPAPCVARPRLPWPWYPSSNTAVGGCHTKLPDRARCARAAGCGSAAAGSGAWQTHGRGSEEHGAGCGEP